MLKSQGLLYNSFEMTKTFLYLGWSSYDFRSHPFFLAILKTNSTTNSLTYQVNWK